MSAHRLLILDDEPMVAQTLAMVGESVGAQTRHTQDPQVFFRLLDDWVPTHVFVDLHMPVMDGLAVLAELGRRGCRAQVIVGSGIGQRVLEAAGRAAKANGLRLAGVLPKPFRSGDMLALLSRAEAGSAVDAPAQRAMAPVFQPGAEELRLAIAGDQLCVHLQPKVRCEDDSLAGFEALVRWQHPAHGLVGPDRFIPLAEREGLVDALTERVLDQALSWFAPWARGRHGPPPALSVNVSARSLGNLSLFDALEGLCRQHRVAPAQIVLELTETAAMDDPRSALETLTRLRLHGFQLSIDDFGTGFSSMLQLVRMPFSELKIDRSFVINAMESQESRTVIRCMIDLGRSLGMTLTAEGVEQQETLALLRSMGCDTAQGYAISPPLPLPRCEDWCRARAA